LTVIAGLVLGVRAGWVISDAVKVAVLAVLRVTLKAFVPATSAALAGKVALLSLEVMPKVSVTLVTRFQSASTARTVTEKAVPAVSALAVPVLPAGVPGAAVSPGTSNCNLAKAPARRGMDELVLGVLEPSELSVAVTVALPPVLSVTLKVCVPAASGASAGSTALASEEVMPTVSVMLVTGFQLVSTAL